MKDNLLKKQLIANMKGVTLIELLIVLVISVIVIGGVYKVFIAQTRAYTVQDQVAEVQQDVRGAMEIMVRDIRMAGFQNSNFATTNPAGSTLITNTPIVVDVANNSHISVNYEYGTYAYTVDYNTVGAGPNCQNPPCLQRTCTSTPLVPPVPQCNGTPNILLTNVDSLNFGYGIDATGDGVVNGINSAGVSVIPDGAFVSGAGVGTSPILTVQITLVAKPAPVDPDVPIMVSKRKLTSVVTPRNVFFRNTTFNRYKIY